MKALKSIKNRLFNCKDSSNNCSYREKQNKRLYYVPAVETSLLFGFQVEAFPLKPSALADDSWAMCTHPRIRKYFFQFFVPNSLFVKQAPAQLLYYFPVPSRGKFEQQGGFNGEAEMYYSYNYPVGYVYPTFASQYELADPIYASRQRLMELVKEESKAISNTCKTLIFNLIEAAKPAIKTDTSALTLGDIWNAFAVLSSQGIELFKPSSTARIGMATYSASLSGLYLSTEEKRIIKYTETQPHYARLPLHNKLEELAKEHPEAAAKELTGLGKESWLAVLWTPVSCVPQVRIEGQFAVFYGLSKECGCGQVGMVCYGLEKCEFWVESLKDKEALKVIEEEERKARKFFGGSCPTACSKFVTQFYQIFPHIELL
eukprot:TRINITY_DN14209_c0_g1_i4.p1 TRINITY_DN14209_c0_g1~~TRINITY_DN14209_c0_g1_i4.p1  ORF type:complete len:374 (-),score=111.46 TRINITY_DN14209_c0_g1_i4:55-1176(-)